MTHRSLLGWGLFAALLVGAVGALWSQAGRAVRYDGRRLEYWLDGLNRPDYRERAQAETALRQLGPEAVPDLVRGLRARDGLLRRWCTVLVDRVTSPRAPRVPKARVREQAALLLARLGPQAVAALPALIAQLADDDKEAVRAAEVALRRIGPLALPRLVAALRHRQPEVRVRAALLLSCRQDYGEGLATAVPALLVALQDPEASVRAEVARTLGEIDPGGRSSLGALIDALADPDPAVRVAAAQALGKAGAAARSAVPGLSGRLTDAAVQVRVEAARALWQIDRQAALAVPVLTAALHDSDMHWRAALALGEIGPAAAGAVPALLEKLQSEIVHRPARTPSSAALALAKMGPAAVPGLLELLEHGQLPVRLGAAIALAGHGADAGPALPGLLQMLREPEAETRIVAANTLGAVGPAARDAIPALNRLVDEPDEYVRAAAVNALTQVTGRRWAGAVEVAAP